MPAYRKPQQHDLATRMHFSFEGAKSAEKKTDLDPTMKKLAELRRLRQEMQL